MSPETMVQALRSLLNADRNLDANEQASKLAFGGKFTPEGLSEAANEAELNGMDLYSAHHMVGLGQTIPEAM